MTPAQPLAPSTPSPVTALKSVVLTTDTPEATAAFYREVLGLPLEIERHRGTDDHFACQVGAQHFAIHPRASFWLATTPAGDAATIVTFDVPDLEGLAARLERLGVPIVARHRVGPMQFIALRDPDGRHVCAGTPWPGPA